MTRASASELSLIRLKSLVLETDSDELPSGMSGEVDAAYWSEAAPWIFLSPDAADEFRQTQSVLLTDLRFEHLDKRIRDATWKFVCHCIFEPNHDHVAMFIDEHSRDVNRTKCFVGIEHLTVNDEIDVGPLTLIPTTHASLPTTKRHIDETVSCFAVVTVEGTHYGNMAKRARRSVESGLSRLRTALADKLAKEQLRFRVGMPYLFEEGLSGWTAHDDRSFSITLQGEFLDALRKDPVIDLPIEPTVDVHKKAAIATRWLDVASTTVDPLEELLYGFFALEAILGNKSEGLKAHDLAFRQAMLDHAVRGSFAHPNRAFHLYKDVRSVAVHGSNMPLIKSKDAHTFVAGVRRTLRNFLAYANENQFQRRSRLLAALDAHPDKQQLEQWLQEHGGEYWNAYLEPRDRHS